MSELDPDRLTSNWFPAHGMVPRRYGTAGAAASCCVLKVIAHGCSA
jgi:hypothetical protein